MPNRASAKHHPHDDAPDTSEAFLRIATLPPGPQRDALRDEVVEAWLPMAERLAGRFRRRGESFEDLRNRVRFACQDLSQTISGRRPTVAEIAEHTRMSEEDVLAGLEALESFTALSLDAELPGSEDGYSLGDALGSPDPALDTVVDREAVKPGLRALPERERAILYMRFFDDMTQSSIAERLGISQMHVSRLISRCCDRLRDQAMSDTARSGS